MRYFVEITTTGNTYTGLIHQGNPVNAQPLATLSLGPNTALTIKGNAYFLAELTQALISHQHHQLAQLFDERGQLELGQHLYNQTFGQLPAALRQRLQQQSEVEVQIITDDEQVSRLPWVLLAHNGIFLTTAGWSVLLSSQLASLDCELPPSPRILVVAPQPVGVSGTDAARHLDVLEDMLSSHDHLLAWDRHLKLVETWEEFTQQVKEFAPQIVYYYGHGEGDLHNARLAFASGPGQQLRRIPVADFALHLRTMPTPPCLVYVNCCLGDAAGYLGVGLQLSSFVPAVITNRTVAMIDAAQAQALALWEDLLLRGIAPHHAVARLYSRLGDLNLSTADVRWLTPVLHGHYATWRANPPSPPSRLVHDPHWHLKIDRVIQYSVVAEQTRQMLRERKPRTHAFVWYGREGEGIEIFHQRLNIELRESLGNVFVYEVRPEWPMEFADFHRSCEDMLLEAFGVNELAAIPARIRARTAGAAGVQTLVYVRHQPVRSPKILDSSKFQRYLEWWDHNFAPLLEAQQFALLGVSFLVNNPASFISRMDVLENVDLHLSAVMLLDQMEKLALKDLRDFLRKHNVRLPLARRDQVLNQILARTGGRYEQTVEELKNLVSLAWNLAEDAPPGEANEDAEEEW